MPKAIEPLYARDGGPPQAYKCLQPSTEEPSTTRPCGMLCATAIGMERHLHVVHNFYTQVTLDELIKKQEAGDGRKG